MAREMDQIEHSRVSSGILYDEASAPLREHAAPPGISEEVPQPRDTRFQEGPFSDEHALQETDVAGGEKTQDAAAGVLTKGKEEKVPFYKVKGWWKTRRWLITWAVLLALTIALIFILLYPVLKAIAQLIVNRSVVNVDTASITSPGNNSFILAMQGVVTHTGIFSAKITFTRPVNVTWLVNDTEIPLGVMTLSQLRAKNKRADLDQTTQFNITDEATFGRFTEAMITQQNFTWRLHSTGLKVRALAFPTATGLKFDKKITLNGINNFDGNVLLKEFQLPSDAEGGGINFVAITELNNKSPFKVDLGTVVFDLYYNNTFLGSGTGTNSAIQPGAVNITLDGVLVKQNTSDDLASLSSLFTAYLNGESSPVIAVGQSAAQSDGTVISWLSDGIKALRLNVPFKNPDQDGPLGPIKSITIGDMALAFSEDSPWAPVANTRTVQAFMKLPFGFNLSIGEIMNNFNISQNGSSIAGLSTPLGASTSDIKVLSPTDTEGTIDIAIEDISLSIPEDQHSLFSQFTTGLTILTRSEFQLVGRARAVANLSLGQVTLDPINFNVTSDLNGLQGLQGDTTITGVDVVGGTTDGITLDINVTIYNPSNLNLSTGDLTLQLFRDGALLGTTLLPNLTLEMGENVLQSTGNFEANNSPQGLQTLDEFVGGQDVALQIGGYDGSTRVASLVQAFGALSIGTTLPGLNSSLLSSTALQVLETTGWVNNTAHVTVNLANPFTAGLRITQISSTVNSHGVSLGSINQDLTFSADGKSTTTSPTIDLDMNLDPSTLFSLTRALAVDAGLGTDQLDGIVALGGYTYVTTTDQDDPTKRSLPAPEGIEKRATNIYTNFNLPDYAQAAFKELRADVNLTSSVTIGDYSTTLNYAQTSVEVVTDETLNLILPYLAQPIVQKIVDGSLLGISTVTITDPQQTSFGTRLNGNITNAGPFDATIKFGSGLIINWSGKPLGTLSMPDVSLAADEGAQLDFTAEFSVADVDHLTEFTKVLVTEESFQWDISGENLTISALGIDVPGINLTTKSVTLLGMNGLQGGVTINSFDLPSDDPAGGIHLTLNTTVQNPAQVGIELKSIGFLNYFQSSYIGPVAAESGFTLAPQSSVDLPLVGRLVAQNDSTGLSDVSTLFNRFIHGQDSAVRVVGDSAGPSDVTWLNEGIKRLEIETSLPNQGVLDIITAITINQMELLFTQDTAYGPATSSKDTTAGFTLPFGFPVDITAVEQNITTGYQGQSFAQLIIPKGPSTTDVDTCIIHLTFSDIPFAVFGDKHGVFQDFLAATTVSESQTFSLQGVANTDASTAVGLLSLTDIEFNVDTSIAGLQGLNTRTTTVSNLDVNHGYSDYLLIKVSTELFNPSNLTIGTGDVSFDLQFQDTTIGDAIVSDMTIIPGSSNYSTDVHYSPQGDAVPIGQQLLENYIQGVDSDTAIQGTTDTTPIDSLKPALAQIRLSPVTIPALHQNLITGASLTFPTDIVQTGVASTSFSLSNPFTASINILRVTAKAAYGDIFLGEIDNAELSLHADGHSNVTSETLPFNFNLNPVNIINLLETRSEQTGVNLGPLPDLFQIVLDNPDATTDITTTVDANGSDCNSGNQFDVDSAIINALQGMGITLSVDSSNKLDDYATDLSFNQSNVPVHLDDTVLYLIGAVAPPIVQSLVDQASLTFNQANISNLANDGFDLALRGSLIGTGPLDAEITFVDPVVVTWNGQDIATISLPSVCAAANDGVPDYTPSGHLSITDQDAFTSFATFLLHNEEFTWTISTESLRVTALGTIFDGVHLQKDVTLKGFNGLPGVTISNFQLPSDDPDGGIHIETDSMIPSPSQLGIDLGTVTFNAYFQDTFVGPLTADSLALPPESTVTEHLTGRIIPQSGSNLENIGTLFSNYLAGENQTLSVVGDSVSPSGSEVTWLSAAFKTLTLSVILPGQKFTIIESITIQDLEVEMTSQDQAFAPLTSSQNTLATYRNPFGFSLQVVAYGENITIASTGGSGIASLNLPQVEADGGVSTGNLADLRLSFTDQPLTAIDNGAFQAFFASVTNDDSVDFSLEGTANVVARTTIGDVPISGIPFDVDSSLAGINSFGGTASLSNVSIAGSGGDGGNQFIVSPLTTTLNNPSNVSLLTNDIALPVIFEGIRLGRAAIDPFDLVPGSSNIATEFHYQPDDANDTTAQSFVTRFVTTDDQLDLTIQGDSESSPYDSLDQALEGVTLSTSLTGLNHPNLISHINVFISVSTLLTNMVEVNFDIDNPLDADLDIKLVQADGSVDGEIYAHFNQRFDNFVVPAHGTANSGTFGNVLLTKGALLSLGIIPLGRLDIAAAQTVQIGVGGYELPWMKIAQDGVSTTYSLSLSLGELQAAAESISESSAGLLSSTAASNSTSSSVEATTTDSDNPVSSVESEVSSVAASLTSSPEEAENSPSPTAESSPSSEDAEPSSTEAAASPSVA